MWEKLYKGILSLEEVDEAHSVSGVVVRHVLERNKRAQFVMDKALSTLGGGGGVTSLSEFSYMHPSTSI